MLKMKYMNQGLILYWQRTFGEINKKKGSYMQVFEKIKIKNLQFKRLPFRETSTFEKCTTVKLLCMDRCNVCIVLSVLKVP